MTPRMRHSLRRAEECPDDQQEHILKCTGLRLNVVSSIANAEQAQGFATAFRGAWKGNGLNVSQERVSVRAGHVSTDVPTDAPRAGLYRSEW